MVHLNRITTRSGDDGWTALGDGTRVPKPHPRVAALGALDELNAAVGFALSMGSWHGAAQGDAVLRRIQNDLFDAGAEVCIPSRCGQPSRPPSRSGIGADDVARLEKLIADATELLAPLDSFVLPGGTPLASALHLARTVCRRAERDMLSLAELEPVGEPLRRYLNRLSDLLFVYARLANDGGRGDGCGSRAGLRRRLPETRRSGTGRERCLLPQPLATLVGSATDGRSILLETEA